MRLGRRLSAGIAEDPPAPTASTAPDAADVPAVEVTPTAVSPASERTPDPAVSGT